MRWQGDMQYASSVDSPLFVKNPLQEVLQGLLRAATGTGEDIETDPVDREGRWLGLKVAAP
jgi:hypothetical protein